MKGRAGGGPLGLAAGAAIATLTLYSLAVFGREPPAPVLLAGLAGIAVTQAVMVWSVWRLRARLESAETRITRLGSDATHELRTPVAAARATLEAALRRPREVTDDRKTLREALHDVQRLWVVVEGLLLMTRDGEGSTLDRRPVSLLDLLSETLALIGPAARDKLVSFVEEVEGEVVVQGDGDRLRLLFYKLLDNAVRFSPSPGTVEVSLKTEGSAAIFVVRDAGPGIPEDDLPFLFDYSLFIRDALPDRAAGSGLGLSLARWVAEAHGGSVTAANRAAAGSRFEVRLPHQVGE